MQKLFFTFILSISALGWGLAQNSLFNARLKLQKIDCNKKLVQVDVQIRSVDQQYNFYLGDANFRFGYDGRLFRNPTITKQHNFSRDVTNGEEYGAQNLNGSSENTTQGLLSLNIFYTGSGKKPQKVTLEWASVATIQFDLVSTNVNTTSQMVWYTPQTFPKTGLSEVVVNGNEFQLKVVNSGIFNNATIPVISEACPNLISNGPSESSVVTKPPITNPSNTSPVTSAPDSDLGGNSVEDSDLVIPEGFSPNGDGVNDVFALHNKKGVKISLQVYNRYGGLVYSNADYQNDWNGTVEDGKNVPDGTYFYIIKSTDGQTFRKALTIVR